MNTHPKSSGNRNRPHSRPFPNKSAPKPPANKTSWQKVSGWYNESVGDEGHYYHQHVVIPGVSRLLNLKKGDSLLDLACGQGVLERAIPTQVDYFGMDIAPSLIKAAEKQMFHKTSKFKVGDVSKPLKFERKYSHAAIILALQNIEKPALVLKNAAEGLAENGKLIIVLNHPCYRIPRQSSWKVDDAQKIQYRRIDRYMTPMEIPIQMNPGAKEKAVQTFSFHYPLASYFSMLKDAGFVVENMEEWCSNKESTGKAAKMENRAREEFPLFMTLLCRKAT